MKCLEIIPKITGEDDFKDEENFAGTLIRMPERNEVPIEINEILIVEFYSK